MRDIGRALLGTGSDNGGPTVAVSFGQNMYTPEDITLTQQQLDDRPWAGFLYGGLGVFDYFGAAHRAADIKVGVIGPASLAKQVQRGYHKLINADEPRGWDNQLRPSLGLQGSYMYTLRCTESYKCKIAPASWAGIHGFMRATVGNPKTLAAAGITLIAGERDRVLGAPDEGDFLAVDFNERTNHFAPPLKNWTFYVQAQLAAVAHNYFITGTTFRDQPQVDIKRTVWMTTIGASWAISKAFRFEYRFKTRSPEYKANGGLPDDRYQRYGEVRFVADLDH